MTPWPSYATTFVVPQEVRCLDLVSIIFKSKHQAGGPPAKSTLLENQAK